MPQERNRLTLLAALSLAICGANWSSQVSGQRLALTPVRESGQSITPVFEGWYWNPDGTISLSYGYFNRNSQVELEIPIGANNFFYPGDVDRGQPTHFQLRRHWGVFAVTVPAEFGDQKLVWTLETNGQRLSVPGSLHVDYQIDALEGEAGSGNTPPSVRFDSTGSMARGPAGTIAGPLATKVGQPTTLTLWATDDGSFSWKYEQPATVMLTWVKHRGPGKVTFSEPVVPADEETGKSTTTAIFSAIGDYVLRVLANDYSGTYSAGHAQCCWTNAYLKVSVTQ